MELNTDFLLDAINTVLSWDIPDEACSDAFTNQACLMAGLESENAYRYGADRMFH
jgi:hypothetical protein